MNREIGSYFYSKISVQADLREVSSVEHLVDIKREALQTDKKIHLIGAGSNQVILNQERYIFIKLNFTPQKYDSLLESFYFAANTHLSQILKMASLFGLKDWEFITGIPASLGGAIFMNAGTRLGEIKSILKSVKILNQKNEVIDVEVDDQSFTYRKNNFLRPGEIILGAELKYSGIDPEIKHKIKEYLGFRNQSQPLGEKNLGCVFKNPSSDQPAGLLIEECGLKGKISAQGNAQVSTKHANFINNISSCSSQEYYEFCCEIKNKIQQKKNVELDFEVQFIK